MGTETKSELTKRSQWSLATLLIVMLGFAIFFGGVSRIHGKVEMQVDFSSLPKNDEALTNWLKDTYRANDIKIERPNKKSIAVAFSRPLYSLDIPSPAWDKLGYGTLGSFVFSQTQVLGWWMPIGLVIIFCAGRLSRSLSHFLALLSGPRQNKLTDRVPT